MSNGVAKVCVWCIFERLCRYKRQLAPIFGTRGFLHYYVNSGLGWGVELLREGHIIAEHTKPFRGIDTWDAPHGQTRIVDKGTKLL